MMGHWFDVASETADIKDPHTREMVRILLDHHNALWHYGRWRRTRQPSRTPPS